MEKWAWSQPPLRDDVAVHSRNSFISKIMVAKVELKLWGRNNKVGSGRTQPEDSSESSGCEEPPPFVMFVR